MRRAALALLGLLALALLERPSVAHAYEGQVGLTLELGYANVPTGALPSHGAYAELGASFGIGDTWEIRGRLAYGWHPEPMHRWAGGAELVYLIDVFQIVPYLGLGVSGVITWADPALLGDFGVGGVVGFDVLLSREVTIGACFRPTVLLTSLDSDPAWLEAGARLQWLIPY